MVRFIVWVGVLNEGRRQLVEGIHADQLSSVVSEVNPSYLVVNKKSTSRLISHPFDIEKSSAV